MTKRNKKSEQIVVIRSNKVIVDNRIAASQNDGEKIKKLEEKYDEQFRIAFEVIQKLISMRNESLRLPIGFSIKP